MPKKILIIEDEQILGEILQSKLTEEGYTVFWELNGEDGLRKIREIKPDMVLLDIVMPKMDGYEVLEEVHKDKTLKNIPIIIISNSGQPVEITRVLKLGAKDYIIKAQFGPDEVLEKMRKYLNKESLEEKKERNKNISDIKILLVEDDAFLSSITVGYLKKEGYDVSSVADGALVLKLLEKNVPDLMLLDVVMPGMNGFEVLKAIKSDERYKNISVVMFSNLGQEHEIEESKRLGAEDFWVKAKFTPKKIIDSINALLKKKGRL
jgi:DNA-binding response OmpR family regulator